MPSFYTKKIERLNIINRAKARKIAEKTRKENKLKFLELLKKENGHLLNKLKNKDIKKIALSILYLGEGTKWKNHRGLMLGSSDPDIITLYINPNKRLWHFKIHIARANLI